MSMKISNTTKYTLSAILAIGLMYFALKGIKWSDFVEGLRSTRWIWVLASMLCAVLALVLRTRRWHLLLGPIDPELRGIHIWDANNVGNLASLAIPGVGEFVRCARVSGPKATFSKTLGTIVLERAWDIVSVVIILLIAILCNGSTLGPFVADNIIKPLSARIPLAALALGLCLIVVVSLVLVYRWRDRSAICGKIVKAASEVLDGLTSFVKMPHKLRFLLQTVLVWLMYILTTWLTFKAVPALDYLSFADAVFISAVGNIASVVPVPGGFGAYHYLVALSLSAICGSSWETGFLAATLAHESHALVILVTGAVSWVASATRRRTPSRI